MTGTAQLVLTLGPLAVYLLSLGTWLAGRRSRVVAGWLDFACLAFGLGGLLSFGPIGHFLVHTLFPGPSLYAWLALPSMLFLAVMLGLPRASRRVVVYNITPDRLAAAVSLAAAALSGDFRPTVRGFEDAAGHRGFVVDPSPRLRTAVLDAYGQQADDLADSLARSLRRELQGVATGPAPLAWVWIGTAALIVMVPLALRLASRPQVRAMLRSIWG